MRGDLAVAERLLSRGHPLPVDLIARLLAEGIDVQALEARFCA